MTGAYCRDLAGGGIRMMGLFLFVSVRCGKLLTKEVDCTTLHKLLFCAVMDGRCMLGTMSESHNKLLSAQKL